MHLFWISRSPPTPQKGFHISHRSSVWGKCGARLGLRWLAGKVRTQVTSMVGRPSVAAQASSLLLGRGDRQPKLVQLWG